MTNKYHNQKTAINNLIFDSRKEANRWQELNLLQRAGEIQDLRRQVTFELVPKQAGERAVKYRADFTYIMNGVNVVEDTKGARTRDYTIKRKLFKLLYPEYIFRES